MKLFTIVVVAYLSVWCVSAGFAGEPFRARSNRVATASRLTTAKDSWRYKFHQGHWWYWLPTNRWAVYEDGHWLASPDQVSTQETRLVSTGNTKGASEDNTNGTSEKMEQNSFAEDYPAVPVDDAVKKLQVDLHKVTASVRRLESQIQRMSSVESTVVRSQTAVLSALRQQANESASLAERVANVGRNN